MLAVADRDIMKSEITAFKCIPSDDTEEYCLGLTAFSHPQYHTSIHCDVGFIYYPYLLASTGEPNPEDPRLAGH